MRTTRYSSFHKPFGNEVCYPMELFQSECLINFNPQREAEVYCHHRIYIYESCGKSSGLEREGNFFEWPIGGDLFDNRRNLWKNDPFIFIYSLNECISYDLVTSHARLMVYLINQ